MKDSKPVTLGFVGCGRIAQTRHLPALSKLPQARVLALSDVDSPCLQRVADQFGVPRRYAKFEEMLDDDDIEAVALCTPVGLHVPLSLAVLEAGKHLFVEKPLALDPSESLKLVNQAEASSKVAMVGFNLRWHRLVRQAKALLQSGSLGDLKMVSTTLISATRNSHDAPSWRNKRELGGGVLVEQAIHHFDLWRFLLQDEVDEVFAAAVNDDESAAITARMASGLLVSSVFSDGTANENEVLFCGKQARLRLSCYHFDGFEIVSAMDHPGDLKVRIKKAGSLLMQSHLAVSQFFRGSDFVASYKNEWVHFIDCVRHGKAPEASLKDGHRSIQILTSILESTVRNVPVKVNSGPLP
jgi:myo-inositol 2-dehydrogenase / D-chiro-inositol 1-dehydrogenase